MISKLHTLRSQLGALRRSRQMFRWGTGWSAALVALLWILAGIFLLDVIFELQVLQRAVVIVVGLGLLAWAISKFTSPYLGQRESEIDMAFMVERQHGIDSDLVAALQFEGSPEAAKWGSRELENAVIDYVAQLDRGLDVFEGFSRETFWKRMGLLAATAAAVIAFAVIAPNYAKVFLNRLALGSQHYPSDTAIDRVLVNGAEVLQQKTHGTAPLNIKSAENQSVIFAAWAKGKLPAEGEKQYIYLAGTGPAGARKVTLDGFARNEVEQLYQQQLKPHSPATPTAAPSGDAQRLASFVSTITPVSLSDATPPAADSSASMASATRLKTMLDQWPAGDDARLYVAKLPRLLNEVKYQVFLGDAWTDPATIAMVGLPLVTPEFTDELPEYAQATAQGKNAEANSASSLQRSVIEGSTVKLALESDKPLKTATLTVIDLQAGGERKDFALHATDGKTRKLWALPQANSPLADIRRPVRFEIQVVDDDDLSLDAPKAGYIRLKADRAPRIAGGLVHRVVLPTATPEIELRATDDFGIKSLAVKVEVTHREGNRLSGDQLSEATFPIVELRKLRGSLSPKDADERKPVAVTYPVKGDQIAGAHKLNISSLTLQRGDELRITLLAEDYRGDGKPGVVAESEPIVLEITDEAGILAAVSDGDRRSQEQIDDLIRRQLGIGETPK